MGRGPCVNKAREMTRAVKAVVAAGLQVSGLWVCPDGGFVVLVGKPGEAIEEGKNPWDIVYDQDTKRPP
jgi:hypothetical protein